MTLKGGRKIGNQTACFAERYALGYPNERQLFGLEMFRIYLSCIEGRIFGKRKLLFLKMIFLFANVH